MPRRVNTSMIEHPAGIVQTRIPRGGRTRAKLEDLAGPSLFDRGREKYATSTDNDRAFSACSGTLTRNFGCTDDRVDPGNGGSGVGGR
jgi:hypothetical protein